MMLLSWTLVRVGLVTVIAVAALCFSVASNAQVPTGGNVFVGYSLEDTGSSSFDLSTLGRPNLDGCEGSWEGKVSPWIEMGADLGARSRLAEHQTPRPPVGVASTVLYEEVDGSAPSGI